jgi:hypothetical protein
MAGIHMFPVGKTLYHGSINKLSTGYPNNPNGNWFATDPRQSILHAAQAAGRNADKIPYLYIYKVIHSPKLIKFNTTTNFNAFATKLGLVLPKGENTFAFSNQNYKVAKSVCEEGVYDGWWFPVDQSQVVLCQPIKFLKFVKVLEIKRPSKGFLTTHFKEGMWKSFNLNKISTIPVKINTMINIRQPSNKYIYSVRNYRGSMPYKYFNVNGNPVNINRSGLTFQYRGKTYLSGGGMSSIGNLTKAKIMVNRIKAKTGMNFHPVNLSQFRLTTKNNLARNSSRREEYNKWLKKSEAHRLGNGNKNNANLNASALYVQK